MTIQTDLADVLTEQFKTMLLTMSEETGALGQDENENDVFMFSESKWNESLDGASGPSMEELVRAMYVVDVAAFVTALGEQKTGEVTFSTSTSEDVTGLDLEDDNYAIALTPDADINVWFSSKTKNGFTVNTTAPSTDTVEWTVTKKPASPEGS